MLHLLTVIFNLMNEVELVFPLTDSYCPILGHSASDIGKLFRIVSISLLKLSFSGVQGPTGIGIDLLSTNPKS